MQFEEMNGIVEEVVESTSLAIIKSLRNEVKKEVLDILRKSFAPIAKDYVSFRPPINDLDIESPEFWIDRFIALAETGYDKSVDKFHMSGTTLSLNLSFLPSEELGFNIDEQVSDKELGWVFFYTSGLRNLTYFVSSDVLLEMRSFFENKGFSAKSPQIQLIDEGLNMVGEFGDGFLITPGEFRRVTDFGVSWSDILTEEIVTPPANTEIDRDFLESASKEIEKTIREGIEKAQLSVRI
jgi:hypothetical protein